MGHFYVAPRLQIRRIEKAPVGRQVLSKGESMSHLCKMAVQECLGRHGIVKEGDDLCTGAGQLRGEGGAAGAVGDTFGGAPFYCFGIPVTVCDVVKEEVCIDIQRAGLAMEEDHGFGAGDGLIWGEGVCTCATDEAFAIAPLDGVGIPSVACNVVKWEGDIIGAW